jgi:hypothetical protein
MERRKNPTENHNIPIVSENPLKTMKKTQVCASIAFCRKAKTKTETLKS